ncbi:ADP-ribosylglycohydrolase family protein [Streptomyces niveus]|uniref:ADP-ribosylglycohydrolase family protein n=1 Tax=Streptomyces niveus TaxID=193462 RepID=UPI003F541C38
MTQACGDRWPKPQHGTDNDTPPATAPPADTSRGSDTPERVSEPAGSDHHPSAARPTDNPTGPSEPPGPDNHPPPTTAPRSAPHTPEGPTTPPPPRASADGSREPGTPEQASEPAGGSDHPPPTTAPRSAPHALEGATIPPPPRASADASRGSGGPPPVSGRGGVGERTALRTHQSHAAWLGRAVGCLLGKPVEKLELPAIRALARATGNWPLNTWFTARGVPADLAAAHPWNRRSAGSSLAENIDGMPEDDDLNYPLLNVLLIQRYGRDFRTSDVARLWLDQLPAGRTFTAERVAYRNLLSGIEPPDTARHHNPFREWIGAAIRADVHGWTHPGDPASAAAQAYRDATLTHTANGVYSAMFVAGTIAAAGGGADVHASLRAGLSVVPPLSRLAQAVRQAIRLARAHTDFDTVVDRLHDAHGHYHWVHAVPNAALLAAALTHADGDFTGSICRAVSGGWDTDSNGATAGSVAGLLAGHPDRLPERWTAPLKNHLATSVVGFDGIGFDELARLTQEALRP